ncbi:metal-dependent transcriptional regulator [Brachybacterium sp. DNPG3]
MNPDELSAVAQDYLKVIWTRTEWGDPPMTVGELAQRFGTSAANVTETLKRLDAQGLVVRVPYQPVALTEQGAKYAVAMVRRHRLIEAFLVDVLGYGWDEVHDEAERLEHAVSDEFIARIDGHLGHPSADPHGDPIPDAEHRWEHPADACRLSDAARAASGSADGARPAADGGAEAYEILVVSDARPETLRLADELGLLPGTVLAPVRTSDGAASDGSAADGASSTAGALRMRRADGTEVDVPRGVAHEIHVRPLPRA